MIQGGVVVVGWVSSLSLRAGCMGALLTDIVLLHHTIFPIMLMGVTGAVVGCGEYDLLPTLCTLRRVGASRAVGAASAASGRLRGF